MEPQTVIVTSENFTHDTRIWRYVRLSTLMLLLQNRAYIPTVAALQQGDPTEAIFIGDEAWRRFDNLLPHEEEYLLSVANDGERDEIEYSTRTPGRREFRSYQFAMIWRRVLAKRRCAWCWYAADIESMAQWHVYAREGVAIATTATKLLRSIVACDPGVEPCLEMREVLYVTMNSDAPVPRELQFKPYFLKQRCYRHEHEVRVMFPNDAEQRNLLLEIDAAELIAAVQVSPLMPMNEAHATVKVIESLIPNADVVVDVSRAHSPFRPMSNDLMQELAWSKKGPTLHPAIPAFDWGIPRAP